MTTAQPAPFILCYPRSGSTLLRLMLDSHPELAIPSETHFCSLFKVPGLLGPVTPALRSALFQEMRAHRRWKDFHVDGDELKARLEGVPDGAPGGRCLAEFWRLYAHNQGKQRWGDKTPGHILCAPAIAAALPEARFIHIVRDGRDVACSMRDSWFGREMRPSQIAREWVDRLSRFRADADSFPGRAMTIRYEDLIADSAAVLTGICRFIEIDYCPAMLAYHERAEARLAELSDLNLGDRVASRDDRLGIHSRASQPPRSDRIGRWKNELDDGEIRAFEAIAADTLAVYGYAQQS